VGEKRNEFYIILMTPQGKTFDQEKAKELSKKTCPPAGRKKLILICGHYEGFDERIREYLVDEEISLGDFVLSGGEIPAMAIVDSVVRLIPGSLGKDESSEEETFSIDGKKLLEYPQYTKPVEYNEWSVPEILLSGNHAEIKKWRLEEAKKRTLEKRPDIKN
jgi:tRNA (guanine37-N1)-methyltransferase